MWTAGVDDLCGQRVWMIHGEARVVTPVLPRQKQSGSSRAGHVGRNEGSIAPEWPQ
jgi:hypothetical protein